MFEVDVKNVTEGRRGPGLFFMWIQTKYSNTRRYGGLRPPTSSSCGGLRGPFGPPDMWGNLF